MEVIINAPKDMECNAEQWSAKYTILGEGEARLIRIESRSCIDVIVSKVTERGFLGLQTSYYISSPNFGVAIPGIPTLQETYWITEQLLDHKMSAPDAVTVAQVLRELEDF